MDVEHGKRSPMVNAHSKRACRLVLSLTHTTTQAVNKAFFHSPQNADQPSTSAFIIQEFAKTTGEQPMQVFEARNSAQIRPQKRSYGGCFNLHLRGSVFECEKFFLCVSKCNTSKHMPAARWLPKGSDVASKEKPHQSEWSGLQADRYVHS